MFHKELEKYKNCGSFRFKANESFKLNCNAPNDKAGVYLIFKVTDKKENLIYIGASGQKMKDGTLKIRKDGLKGRLIYGYHPNRFGEAKRIQRQKAFPQQMLKEDIKELRFYWWVTYDEFNQDFPIDIETILREKYKDEFNRLPKWHK